MSLSNQTDWTPASLKVLSGPVRQALQRILQPEERVLWAGKAVPGAAWGDMMPGVVKSRWVRAMFFTIIATVSLGLLALFLLMFIGGLVLDLQRGKFGMSDALWLLLFLPFVLLITLPLLVSIIYPWLSIRRARHRSYVLTNHRAVTAREISDDVQLELVELGTVEEPSLSRLRRDGVGDVIFGGFVIRTYTGDGGMDIDTHIDTGFTACPEAERVIALFTEARAHRRKTYERDVIEEMGRDYQGYLRRTGRL
jgi:hypothetical protein